MEIEDFQDKVSRELQNHEIIVELNILKDLLEKVKLLPVAIPIQAKLQSKISEVKLIEGECAKITQSLLDESNISTNTI